MVEVTTDPHRIYPGAFVGALMLAPLALAVPALVILSLLAAAETGPGVPGVMLMMAVFAIPLGAPTYLTFGAAAFWLTLRAHADGAVLCWITGLVAHLVSVPAIWLFFSATGSHDADGQTLMIAGFGAVFAPLWGGIFGMLYSRFTRSARAQ